MGLETRQSLALVIVQQVLRGCLKMILQNRYVQSMDDNCGEWVECMSVASGCGEQEVGVASVSGWNLWVWLAGSECV